MHDGLTYSSVGVVSTFAGSTCGLANGAGAAAKFNHPVKLTIDPVDSALYVADYCNHAIRKISTSGTHM